MNVQPQENTESAEDKGSVLTDTLASLCVDLLVQGKWRGAIPPDAQRADFLSCAIRHSLVPMLCRAVPRGEWPQLDRQFYASAALSARLMDTGTRVVALLESAGITAFPFKGPWLAAWLYGDAAARMSSDLDMLIAPGDFGRAVSTLEASGFHATPEVTGTARRLWEGSGRGYDMVERESGVVVDLYSSVTPDYLPGRLDWQKLAASGREIEAGEMRFRAPSAEEYYVLLCMHGAKHLWSRLIWICDLQMLSSRPGFSWDRVKAVSERWKCERLVAVGAAMQNRVFGGAAPGALAGLAPRRMVEACVARLYGPEEGGIRPSLSDERFYLDAWGGRKVVQALRLAFRPTASDAEWLPLPSWLLWLYPLLRPFRIALKTLRMRRRDEK